jgi:hypothetical protein
MEELDFFDEICLTSLYASQVEATHFIILILIPALNNKATICWFDWGSNKSHLANQEENK